MKLLSNLCFLLLITSTQLNAQSTKINEILNLKYQEVDSFALPIRGYTTLPLPTIYGKSTILNTEEYKEVVGDKPIHKIQLIYTAYAQSSTFPQTTLNRNRLNSLHKLDNRLLSDTSITWEIIAQTNIKSPEDGAARFHGFIIYYDRYESVEIREIRELMEEQTFEDSTVLSSFNRNTQWKNMLVVADLTGSMSSYTAQVLLWLKLNETTNRAKYFTFFNDGDATNNEDKEIGKTGGIYQSSATNFEKLLPLVGEVMKNGDGGDKQENDIEALLVGINNCPDCQDVVIIADNKSPIRDIELLNKINKPIHIILCGFEDVINPQYLDIAYATKGSIHTIKDDLNHLMKLQDGAMIQYNGFAYLLKDGKFKYLGKN